MEKIVLKFKRKPLRKPLAKPTKVIQSEKTYNRKKEKEKCVST
jgi:hypothetical protein